MRHAPTRSIPPPIDLSVSGSNLRETKSTSSPRKDAIRGGQHPYTFTCKYIIERDEGPSISSTAISPSPSPNSGLYQTLAPISPNPYPPNSSTSTSSFLSVVDLDNARLVPNRRRRSYSESGYSPGSPFSTQRSVSGPASDDTSSTPNSTEFSNSLSSPPARSLRTSPSFPLGLRNKYKASASPPVDSNDQTPKQRASTTGRRTKLWSSITHFPLSAGLSLDFGHSGDKNYARTTSKNTKRPGTSPSTPSSWMSFTDAPVGNINGAESLKKNQRPSTASSAAPSSTSSPLRTSKLDWHRQWKRFSLLRTSSPSASLTPMETSPLTPPTPSIHSIPSPLSTSSTASFTPFPPSSPNPQPPTPRKAPNLSHRTRSPTKSAFGDSANLPVIPNPKLRNRSTPNLQTPDLSMEDLGKVNAFYAPPPPPLVVQAISASPRHRTTSTTSSGPKLKSRLPLPPEIPDSTIPKLASKQLLIPMQSSVSTQDAPNGGGIPITLPLSPALSKSDSEEEEVDVIYLTVENFLDEESGETVLRLVEVPM